MCARQRGVSSELVALLAPVEPIFDRLPGLVIGRDHFELESGTANSTSSQSISTNISCSQSSTGAMPITSISSPTFSGEVDLLAAHRARKGKLIFISR